MPDKKVTKKKEAKVDVKATKANKEAAEPKAKPEAKKVEKKTSKKETKATKSEAKPEFKVEAKAKKKSKKKSITSGHAYVQATFNNTVVTISDQEGNALVQGSPRTVGFAGSKISTAFAATKAASEAASIAMKRYGLKEVKVFITGPGSGRNAAVKGLEAAGLRVTLLTDRTPIPHNGCRSRKAPRN